MKGVTAMSSVISIVLTTVTAPFGMKVSAREFADKLQDPASAISFDAAAFACFPR